MYTFLELHLSDGTTCKWPLTTTVSTACPQQPFQQQNTLQIEPIVYNTTSTCSQRKPKSKQELCAVWNFVVVIEHEVPTFAQLPRCNVRACSG